MSDFYTSDQMMADIWGNAEMPDPAPEPIKFKELEKGEEVEVRIIGDSDTSIQEQEQAREDGIADAFGEEEVEENPMLFVRVTEDRETLRIVSRPMVYTHIWDINGRQYTAKRYLTHVIDRGDNQYKIWSFGQDVYNQINSFVRADPINDPSHYDLNVWLTGAGRSKRYHVRFCDLVQPTSAYSSRLMNLYPLEDIIAESSNMTTYQGNSNMDGFQNNP